MKDFQKYKKIISECLNDAIEEIELVSNTSNLVFRVDTKTYGVVYIKFYLNHSSHIDHEMKLYDMVDSKYLKDIIFSSEHPKFTIFRELKGRGVDELSLEEREELKERIVDSIISFFESIGKHKANGYGLLDENLNGTKMSFQEFIVERQMSTQEELNDYPFLNDLFTKIYEKYKDLLVGDNSFVPIDTNMKNIMLTDDGEIKFIDPGELISAPIMMGYGDVVAHTYQTELCDCLLDKLNLDEDDMKRIRIYAIFSSLNILAFLKRLGVDELEKVVPYGNTHTFFELIQDHLEKLELSKGGKAWEKKYL